MTAGKEASRPQRAVIDLGRVALVDVEASSLGRDSYPIEVGWCFAETGEVESHLIIPHPDWLDWDPGAQEAHGLSRSVLFERGEPGPSVARRLVTALAGFTVYSDSEMDQRWLRRLCDAVGVPTPAVQPFDALLDAVVRPEPEGGAGDWLVHELARATGQGAIIDEAYARAGAIAPKVHRAGPDARHLQEVLSQVLALMA